jgi:hypothetical protein
MQQVKIIENVNLKDKRWSLVRYLLLGLLAVVGFAFSYQMTVSAGPKNTVRPALPESGSINKKEASQQAVLQWMKENSAMPEKVLAKIYSVAMESVNADLILAICLVESNFNPHVESGRGAVGLMGIMPGVWLEELRSHGIVTGREDLFTISKNIDAGVYVLESYLGKTDNLKVALSRYAGGDPSYAARVLQMQKKITLTRRSELNPSLAAVHY